MSAIILHTIDSGGVTDEIATYGMIFDDKETH